jgi:hypothetical protein
MTVPVIHADDPWPLRMDADGVIRVGKGRHTLNTVIAALNDGLSPGDIALGFDLVPEVVYAAISYYYRHQDELKPYLDQQAYDALKLREQVEAEQSPFPTRAELLDRLR